MDNYNYHKGMNVIIQELKVLLKTKSIGTDSDQALLLDFQVALGTIYLMTANLPQAKTHFKRAVKRTFAIHFRYLLMNAVALRPVSGSF